MFITRKKFEEAIAEAREEATNEVYKRMDEENRTRWVGTELEKLELRVRRLEKDCVRRRVKEETEEMLPF